MWSQNISWTVYFCLLHGSEWQVFGRWSTARGAGAGVPGRSRDKRTRANDGAHCSKWDCATVAIFSLSVGYLCEKKTEHAPNNVSPTKHLTNKKLLFYPPRAGSGLDLEAMMRGDIDVEQLDGMRNVLFCSTCAVGINSVLDALENGTDYDTITNNFINVCIDLGIASPIVCENFLLDSKVTCGRRRTLQRPLMNIVEMNDVAFPCVSSNN